MKFIGSAAAILVNKMKEDMHLFDPELFNKNDPRNFAYFIGAPIILDTHNFYEEYRDKKWSHEDELALQCIAPYCSFDQNYFMQMQNNKFSKEAAIKLGFLGNIRRDYKQYRLKKGSVEGRLGCAVMVFGPTDMF